MASLPNGRAIRVLEVGGGTGVLTRTLLPDTCRRHRTEYLFTDVGATFVAAARKRFEDVSFMEYQIFDVETDPAAQGITQGSSTSSSPRTSFMPPPMCGQPSASQKCLAPGGLVVLLELLKPEMVRDDVTFGLLRGYSRFTDTDIRPHSALMDRAGGKRCSRSRFHRCARGEIPGRWSRRGTRRHRRFRATRGVRELETKSTLLIVWSRTVETC